MNTFVERNPDAVQRAIATFFAERRAGNWPISISEGLASIRRWNPNLPMTDPELVRMVAEYAVGRGLNVYFDGPPRRERSH